MFTVRPFRHRRRSAAALLVLAPLALAACSSSAADTPTGKAAAGSSAASTALPTQDVLAAVKLDPKLKAELPADVQASGKIILGTPQIVGQSGLPHGGQDASGKGVGLDIDLRDAIAKELGVTWDVQNGTFATIIPGVQNGKYQVGQANFGVTKAREEVVDFATYLNDGQAFLGAKSVDFDKVSTLTDICGYAVATSPGSTFQQILTQGADKCAAAGKKPYTVQYFADTAPIFLGLANGKVDIFFGPTLSLKYDEKHIAGTKFLGQISSTPVGFVTAKNSPLSKALADATNKLIESGDYAKIFAKWAVSGTGITKSAVNPTPTL